jgi:hypothetical protein
MNTQVTVELKRNDLAWDKFRAILVAHDISVRDCKDIEQAIMDARLELVERLQSK